MLASLFETAVPYIVFASDKKQAWIKDYKEEETAKKLVEQLDGYCMNGQKISCHHVTEIYQPAELCRYAMNGKCFYSENCYYKHIPCSNPYHCQRDECYLQHYAIKKMRLIPEYRM
jgi:hypothetical protein